MSLVKGGTPPPVPAFVFLKPKEPHPVRRANQSVGEGETTPSDGGMKKYSSFCGERKQRRDEFLLQCRDGKLRKRYVLKTFFVGFALG